MLRGIIFSIVYLGNALLFSKCFSPTTTEKKYISSDEIAYFTVCQLLFVWYFSVKWNRLKFNYEIKC